MTGQLAVPLHHVEDVGDIAVLPPAVNADGSTTRYYVTPPAPVVGQVVAHVEKCSTCRGLGHKEFSGQSVREPYCVHSHNTQPMNACDICRDSPRRHEWIEGWKCDDCGGSGWVRDQYVRITAVFPIIAAKDGRWDMAGKALFVWESPPAGYDPDDRIVDWGDQRSMFVLPGAVPGGVALIVEPLALAPEQPHTGDRHEFGLCCHDHPPLGPVSAPSAPYTEDQ